MALTLEKQQRLAKAGLEELFRNRRSLWRDLADGAYRHTKEVFEGIPDAKIRPDDVVAMLVPGLTVNPELQTELDKKRLPQKFYTWFAELILDRLWTELTTAKGEA